tara:strand:+ start:556 stop:1170 length:615 start_codon:yes stop_codon:yes gene_type:complete
MNSSTTKQNNPLQIFNPMNIIVWTTFYSPIILAISITSLSFIFQNFKGLIYLALLLFSSIIRNYIYKYSGGEKLQGDGSICTSVEYSEYGNATFSAFVFAFTIMYLSLPMFSNGAANFWVFGALVVYFFIDIYIKIYKGCIVNNKDLILNILVGVVMGGLFVSVMSSKYVFFNEVSSNKDMCSQPKEQTFKCQVYKDGTLVGSI